MRRLDSRVLRWAAVWAVLIALTVRMGTQRRSPDVAPPHPVTLLAGALEPVLAPAKEVVPVRDSDAEAPETLVHRLRLRGTAVMEMPLAWIEDLATGTTREYRQGEPILDARLLLITRGAVWLERAERRLALQLEEGAVPSVPDAAGPAALTVSRAGVSESQAMRVTPHLADSGLFEGLLVESLPRGAWWSRLGLQEGDLILAVNGQPLAGPQQALQVMRKAIRQPTLALLLRRRSAPELIQARLPLQPP